MSYTLSIGRSKSAPDLDDWYLDGTPLAQWMSWFECEGPTPKRNGFLFTWFTEDLHALLGRPLAGRTPYRNKARQAATSEARVLASGRVPLYLCSQCGDLGCDSFAVRVGMDGSDPETVTWTDFAWESDSAPELGPSPDYDALPPIEFSRSQYETVIHQLLL